MSDRATASDGQLAQAAARGDRAAFDVLVGRYQRRVTSVAFRLLGNVDDAQEVAQDALLKAYDKLPTLAAPERFGSWLLRIVSNLSLNRRRRRALRKTLSIDQANAGDNDDREERSVPDPHADTPVMLASAAELKEGIRAALDELPEKQRMALVLFSLEKMPQRDVARQLDMSVEAVKWHVFTARKKLKERFKDYL